MLVLLDLCEAILQAVVVVAVEFADVDEHFGGGGAYWVVRGVVRVVARARLADLLFQDLVAHLPSIRR